MPDTFRGVVFAATRDSVREAWKTLPATESPVPRAYPSNRKTNEGNTPSTSSSTAVATSVAPAR